MNGREQRGAKKAKKGGRKGSDSDGYMSDDAAAGAFVASATLNTKDEDGNDLSPEDIQDQLVEQLAEKRASTRQAALARFIDQLQLNFEYDFLSSRLDTLQLYLLNSVRKGDAPEVVLACRALALMAITLGPEGEKLMQDATPVLHTYLKNTSKSPAGRAATAEALGFLSFMGGAGDKDTLDAMTLLIDALQSAAPLPEAAAVACWEAWGLLASTLSTNRQGGDICEAHLPTLMRFLDDESLDVKTAAGENIALLIAAKQELEAERAEYEEEAEEGEEDEQKSAAASSRKKGDIDMPALISKLSELSTDGNRHRAKKDRAVQRKSFRDILHTVEDGTVPDESLKIEKSRHEFEGWAHIKQLNAVRDVLAKGLNTHFVHNPTLRDVFDLYIESGDGVDDPNRKAASRAQSRAKAIENFHQREKGRKKKQALTNPLGED